MESGRALSKDPVLQSASEPLKLSSFRQHLIRLEETIIFALIERAQFPRNVEIYATNNDVARDLDGRCLLDHMLREIELSHARLRRYTSPDENAFFTEECSLVTPLLPHIDYPHTIKSNRININDKIKNLYTESVLPTISENASDARTYGSTAVADIACLQALSKRIHYGKFVAEAKYQADREVYEKLIKANDAQGLMSLLTDLVQEERVLDRVEKKASTYGQDPADQAEGPPEYKVDPKIIRTMYKDIVMPLTKDVQVDYLLQRIRHPCIVSCAGDAQKAAVKHFSIPDDYENLLLVDGADAVFAKVLSNEAAYGVVIIESHVEGASRQVKQLLVETNLKILAEIISHSQTGDIRCIVISKVAASASGKDKSCIAFGTSHEAGALHRALGCFHEQGVNLTSIESLPSRDTKEGFKYDFFVELEGALEDEPVKRGIQQLEKEATFVRQLGTFAMQDSGKRPREGT